MFDEADKWLMNAKGKLDTLKNNSNVPNFIAFEMLTNAKSNANDDLGMDGEDLLINENQGKNTDIIQYGETIAEKLSALQTSNPQKLGASLDNLNLTFEEATINALNSVSNCSLVDGVDISNEELEALKDAANAKANAMEGKSSAVHEMPDPQPVQQVAALEQQFGGLNLN